MLKFVKKREETRQLREGEDEHTNREGVDVVMDNGEREIVEETRK